ncbi:hypothetical protein ACFYWO_38040 [Streptomyces sp. NPDC002932]|uniref:hypothetical protein n=1 Tax=Streptomyces sp. NPDC002932 TaxID=3364672 RepID=UPI00369D8126
MRAPAPYDLYTRYMTAADIWRTHLKGCPTCRAGQPCKVGEPLVEQFVRLQDAYAARQKMQR